MMGYTTRIGLGVLAAALGLGLLGDSLLRALPWGINVLLFVIPLLAAALLLARHHGMEMHGDGGWLVLPVMVFAGAFAWRSSLTLKTLDGMGLLIALALLALHTRSGQMYGAGILDYGHRVLMALIQTARGTLALLFGSIHWNEIPRSGWTEQGKAVLRGLLIVTPLLIVFGALFIAADAVFEHQASQLLNLDWDMVASHLALFLACFWLAGGLLWTFLLREARPAGEPRPRREFLGMVEVATVLGMLDLLFLCFVLVQLRYFFGGAALVQATTGLTYAVYARRGFFELVTVAALALPVLLTVDAVLRREQRGCLALFRMLAAVKVLLLVVIMASALQRMWLYAAEFGLTEERLYTTAFMGWLAVVFAWFLATVLRGRREHFALGALAAGFTTILVLHALNPNACIVRANVRLQNTGRIFDAAYATSLGPDAAPAMIEALPSLDAGTRRFVTARMLHRWAPPGHPDWRSWDWGRATAWAAVGRVGRGG